MQIALIFSNASITPLFFSSPTRIIENPNKIAITIICSILAFVIGVKKLEGKIFTKVSIKDVEADAE